MIGKIFQNVSFSNSCLLSKFIIHQLYLISQGLLYMMKIHPTCFLNPSTFPSSPSFAAFACLASSRSWTIVLSATWSISARYGSCTIGGSTSSGIVAEGGSKHSMSIRWRRKGMFFALPPKDRKSGLAMAFSLQHCYHEIYLSKMHRCSSKLLKKKTQFKSNQYQIPIYLECVQLHGNSSLAVLAFSLSCPWTLFPKTWFYAHIDCSEIWDQHFHVLIF